MRRLREGRAVVVDVRPAEEYRAGHIPGAFSVPVAELDRRLAELPRRRRSSRTAAGPYCVYALRGRQPAPRTRPRAPAPREGVPEWRAAGLPVDATAAHDARRPAPRLGLRANLGAVLAARRSSTPSSARWSGSSAASCPRSPSRSSTCSRAHRDAVVHRRLRRHQGAHQLPRRPPLRIASDGSPCWSAGWVVAVPVPFLLMWAPTWGWVLFANVLLGVSQGLTWSTTVIMKIDLAGPAAARARDGPQRVRRLPRGRPLRRSPPGCIAARYGLRPEPFYLGRGLRRRRARALGRCSCARRAATSRWSRRHAGAAGERPLASARSSRARRSATATSRRQPGRPREQPQRRHGAGASSRSSSRPPGMSLAADRLAGRDVPGGVGRRRSSSRVRCPTASDASG